MGFAMDLCRISSGLNSLPRARASHQLLTNSREFADVDIHTQAPGPGGDDITLHASVRQLDTAVDRALVPVLRFHEGGCMKTLAMVEADDDAQYCGRVLQVAAGVRPR
jgi:hypothetical protein